MYAIKTRNGQVYMKLQSNGGDVSVMQASMCTCAWHDLCTICQPLEVTLLKAEIALPPYCLFCRITDLCKGHLVTLLHVLILVVWYNNAVIPFFFFLSRWRVLSGCFGHIARHVLAQEAIMQNRAELCFCAFQECKVRCPF